MMHRAGCTAAAFAVAALVAACGGGGGGGGSSGDSAGAPPAPSSNASAYQNSMTLGSVGAVSLSLIAATTTVNAMLVSPVAAPLLVAGNNALV